jgi:hypothetical protein
MTMSLATDTAERDAVLELWAESTIEMHRFGCDADRVLARWDEKDVDALMPTPEALGDLGFDIVGLAKALEAGLNAELFGKAYRLLDIDAFNQALVAQGAGFDISLYNEGLLAGLVNECA